jgi:hypothetical protein
LLLVRLQDDEHDPGMHAETATVLGRRVTGVPGRGTERDWTRWASAWVPATTRRVSWSLSARLGRPCSGETTSGAPDSLRIVNVSP